MDVDPGSEQVAMERIKAAEIARMVGNQIIPYCVRLEIAGSIRRGKDEVGDIELVAMPKMEPVYDLWGEKVGEHSLLNDRSIFEAMGKISKSGKRFVQVELLEGINLDLFIVLPPAQWGVILAIRTGPVEFSQWIVTSRSKGGALLNGWKVEEGRVWDGQTELTFNEEIDFLKWLELGWIEPRDRKPNWNPFKKSRI